MGRIPEGQIEFKIQSKTSATKWGEHPELVLLWLTQVQFEADADDYGDIVDGRLTEGAQRPAQTQVMRVLMRQQDKAGEDVKLYIGSKYGKELASSHFPQFGFIHRNSHWTLPDDHAERSTALGMMVAAIAAEGFGANVYGTAFWTAQQTNFGDAFEKANSIDGVVSEKIADREVLRAKLNKGMVNLYKLIECQYPDTFEGMLRDFGVQNEDM